MGEVDFLYKISWIRELIRLVWEKLFSIPMFGIETGSFAWTFGSFFLGILIISILANIVFNFMRREYK